MSNNPSQKPAGKKDAKPRLMVKHRNVTYLFGKHPQHRNHYTLLTPEQQTKYQSADTEAAKDALWKCDEIDLDDSRNDTWKRDMNRLSQKKRSKACLAFCTAPHMFQNPAPAWSVLLLSLMAIVLDLAAQVLPKGPVVCLQGVTMLPEVLGVFLQAVHGPEVLKTKNSCLKCPSYIRAVHPLGAFAPSLDLEDYLGGHAEVDIVDNYYFWLPPHNTAVAIAANTPLAVQKTIFDFSAYALPICCFTPPKTLDKTVVYLDGTAFNTFDPDMKTNLMKRHYQIHLILGKFDRWLHKKTERWSKCVEDAEAFHPTARNGRFVATTVTDELSILAVSLAVFKNFLSFAAEKQWITLEDARLFLDEAWQQVLPESFPKVNAESTLVSGAWDEPTVFFSFLGEYLQEHQHQISLTGAPCNTDIVAVVHELPDGTFLILPREQFILAYRAQLHEKGIALPDDVKNLGAKIQRTILNWGIPVKTEGKDITWRFSFYDKAIVETPKVPCLAFPLDQLPDPIKNGLSDWFGEPFGRLLQVQPTRTKPEAEKIAESEENMENGEENE